MAHLPRAALLISLKGGPNLPEHVIRRLLSDEAEHALTVNPPFHLVNHLISPDSTSLLDDTKTVLRSRRFDCVLIGFGIRGNPHMTPQFDALVNAVVETCKPVPKFSFPTNPNGVVEAALPYMPKKVEAEVEADGEKMGKHAAENAKMS